MAKAVLKTRLRRASVVKFLATVKPEKRREECDQILKLMKQVTGEQPKMWGSSIVGFGTYHYKGKSGREGDWFRTGFSPRKQNLTVYLLSGFDPMKNLQKKLGKHSTGGSCLYLNGLDQIDMGVLKEMIEKSWKITGSWKG